MAEPGGEGFNEPTFVDTNKSDLTPGGEARSAELQQAMGHDSEANAGATARPEYRAPNDAEIAAHKAAAAERAREAVATADSQKQPQGYDKAGYALGNDGYTSGRMSGPGKRQAEDAFNASMGYSTSAERAQKQAEMAAKANRGPLAKLWGRLRGR